MNRELAAELEHVTALDPAQAVVELVHVGHVEVADAVADRRHADAVDAAAEVDLREVAVGAAGRVDAERRSASRRPTTPRCSGC
jgi:hypothetical protein